MLRLYLIQCLEDLVRLLVECIFVQFHICVYSDSCIVLEHDINRLVVEQCLVQQFVCLFQFYIFCLVKYHLVLHLHFLGCIQPLFYILNREFETPFLFVHSLLCPHFLFSQKVRKSIFFYAFFYL